VALFRQGVRPLLYQRPSAPPPGLRSATPRRPVPGLVVGSGRRTTLRRHAGDEHQIEIEATYQACPPSQSGYAGAGGLRGAAGMSHGSHLMLARGSGSGLPMPLAGPSLRASCPPLARCFLRYAILASRKKQRRLTGTGSPSLRPLQVAQVFNLCAFPVRIWLTASSLACAIPEGERPDRRHAQKPVRRVNATSLRSV